MNPWNSSEAAALLSSDFSLRLTQSLLHFLWQGLAIGLLLWIADRALRRATSRARYLCGVAALLLMVACLPATYVALGYFAEDTPAPIVSSIALPAAEASPSPAIDDSANVVAVDASAAGDLAAKVGGHAARSQGQHPSPFWNWLALQRLTTQLAPYAAAAYLLGVAMMLARLTVALASGQRLRSSATLLTDADVLAMVARQARRIGLKVVPAIAWCQRAAVPLVVGIVRPMILLPTSIAGGLAPDQLEALLAHELAHLKRLDLAVNLVQRLAESLLFFHPAVWYVSRRISIERENCCDDCVLAAGWGRLEYADALVRMAEACAQVSGLAGLESAALLAASGNQPSLFKRRVLRLLDKQDHLRVGISPAGVCSAVGLAFFAALVLLSANLWSIGDDLPGHRERESKQPAASPLDLPKGEAQYDRALAAQIDAAALARQGLLALSPDRKLLAYLDTAKENHPKNVVKVLDAATGKLKWEFQSSQRITKLRFSDRGLVVTHVDGSEQTHGEDGKVAAAPSAANDSGPPQEKRYVRGQDALDRIGKVKPAWSKAQGGIEFGIALIGDKTTFTAGQRVPLEMFVRNIGKQEVKVSLTADFHANVPVVKNAAGEVIFVERILLFGTVPVYRETLRPGEAFGFRYLGMGLGKNPTKSIWHPFVAEPKPGKYTLRHTQVIDVTPTGDGNPAQQLTFTTGEVAFEVAAAGDDDQAVEEKFRNDERLLKSQVFVAQKDLDAARRALETSQRLARKGLLTPLQLAGVEATVKQAESELASAQDKLARLQANHKTAATKRIETLLDKVVALQVTDRPLIFVLDDLEKAHGIPVTIDLKAVHAKGLSEHTRVTIDVTDKPLREVFKSVLAAGGLDFEVAENGIAVPAKAKPAAAPGAEKPDGSARLLVKYDIPGAEEEAQIVVQHGRETIGPKAIGSLHVNPLKNGQSLELKDLPSGDFEVTRYRTLMFGNDFGVSRFLDRRQLTLQQGQIKSIEFTRPHGRAVRGKVLGFEDAGLYNVLIDVCSENATSEKSLHDLKTILFDARHCADDRTFTTEPLAAGTYTILAEGYVRLTDAQRTQSGIIRPLCVGVAKVTVPETGEMPPLEVKLEDVRKERQREAKPDQSRRPSPEPDASIGQSLRSAGVSLQIDPQGRITEIYFGASATDDMLQQIGRLPQLKKLYIELAQQLTLKAFESLAALPALQSLGLYDVRLPPKALASLARIRSLKELSLGDCSLTDADLVPLEKLAGLTSFSLRGNAITDEGLDSLVKLQELEVLDLGNSSSVGSQMQITDQGLAKLTVLTRLKQLNLSSTRLPLGFSDRGLANLSAWKDLESLDISGPNLGDEALGHIGRCTNLRHLGLHFAGFTDEGMKEVAKLTRLKEISLSSSRVTEKGLLSLGDLPALEFAELRTDGVTDRVLERLSQTKTLARLDLYANAVPGVAVSVPQFTAAGLAHLKGHPGLRTLWLTNMTIDESMLASLKNLTQLFELTLMMPSLSDDQVRSLQAALPKARVSAAWGGHGIAPLQLQDDLKRLGLPQPEIKAR